MEIPKRTTYSSFFKEHANPTANREFMTINRPPSKGEMGGRHQSVSNALIFNQPFFTQPLNIDDKAIEKKKPFKTAKKPNIESKTIEVPSNVRLYNKTLEQHSKVF